jgi:hypothetical protein
MDHPLPRRVAPTPTQQNIDAIAKQHEALGQALYPAFTTSCVH